MQGQPASQVNGAGNDNHSSAESSATIPRSTTADVPVGQVTDGAALPRATSGGAPNGPSAAGLSGTASTPYRELSFTLADPDSPHVAPGWIVPNSAGATPASMEAQDSAVPATDPYVFIEVRPDMVTVNSMSAVVISETDDGTESVDGGSTVSCSRSETAMY